MSSQGLIPTPFSQIKIKFSEISCYAPPCLPPSVPGSWTVSLKPPCGQTLGSQQTEACCFRKPQSLHTQAVSPPLTCLWLHQLLSIMSSFRVWLQPKLQGGTSHRSHESRMTVGAVEPKQEADKRQWFCSETRGGTKTCLGVFWANLITYKNQILTSAQSLKLWFLSKLIKKVLNLFYQTPLKLLFLTSRIIFQWHLMQGIVHYTSLPVTIILYITGWRSPRYLYLSAIQFLLLFVCLSVRLHHSYYSPFTFFL